MVAMEENMENKVNKTSIPVDAAEPITGIIAEGISERWPATDERIEINESSKEETGQTAMMPMIFGVAGGVVSPFSPAVDISEFSGSLAIKIPIEVPPGRLNMAPRLFLTYDNYHANGWIGVGWVLDMGAVRRSTKHGLDYDANDYVAAISGSSSDLVSRNDWGAGYYGARTEGALSKYFLNATTGGWEVTTKDGTIYYYGTTSDSRQDFAGGTKIFKWCLDRVKDANGNYMTIAYTKSQGEIYLDRIDYAGNTNLSP